MADDYYKFDEKRMVFRGYRTRRQIKIGDKLAVRCLKADIDRRVIDFGLVDVAAISLPSRKQKDNVIAWKNKK